MLSAVVVTVVTVVIILFVSRSEVETLPPSLASYLGVYEPGSPGTYQTVANFSRATDTQPNLVGYYSGWGEPFAASFAEKAHGHSAATILQMDPTNVSIAAIASGDYDSYLRAFARNVRDFGHPVVIGFGHEMNASWYSWGYGHVPATAFVAAWRHIVTLFRTQGAENVTWLWTIDANSSSTGPLASWWPGAQYVTWVGIDGYYYRPSDTFAKVFGTTIDQVRSFTDRPVLLSETAVGPDAGQFTKISNLFAGMHRYRTLGLVWFDFAENDGIYRQDWHIEGDFAAETAFRIDASALKLVRP
jgi:mannan endo-1,4-beta-mannosidase